MKTRAVFVIPGVVIFIVVLFLVTNNYHQRKDEYLNRRLAVFQTRIEATGRTLSTFSRYVFEQTINHPDILSLMQQAVYANGTQRDSIRRQLYSRIRTEYERLEKYNFRQLHFQLPDNTSFLRMHSPDKYGDNLSDVRETIRRTNETKKVVFAYEEGRIYNGYRFVYPLFSAGEHCGSVEVSFSMQSFIDILSQMEDSDYYFGIRKSIAESVLFPDDRNRYVDSCFSPDFLFDREVLPRHKNEALFQTVQTELQTMLDSGESGGFAAIHGGGRKIILVQHVRNLAEFPVACFLSVSDDRVLSHYFRDYLVIMAISVVIFITLLGTAMLLVREREKLRHLSLTDMLTGLRNRVALVDILEQELDRALRYDKPLSVMMIDIDNFKQVNDRFGHAEGDTVLKNLARLMRSALRTSDYAARWGGEEFLVLLTDTPFESGLIAAENFCAEVSSSYISSLTPVTISIGIASLCPDDTIDSLIARSDEALYEAKRQGKNRVSGIKKE